LTIAQLIVQCLLDKLEIASWKECRCLQKTKGTRRTTHVA